MGDGDSYMTTGCKSHGVGNVRRGRCTFHNWLCILALFGVACLVGRGCGGVGGGDALMTYWLSVAACAKMIFVLSREQIAIHSRLNDLV